MIQDKPEAIMINVPEAFFKEKSEEGFRRYYEHMGQNNNDHSFYHFIASIPVHEVNVVFVCFKGKVQYKAIIVEFIRNASPFDGWQKRNWMVTTGPVIKAPEDLIQKGFRGFRYSKILF